MRRVRPMLRHTAVLARKNLKTLPRMAKKLPCSWLRLVSTLHEHHEHILHRLDFQDDLLKRLSLLCLGQCMIC